MIAVWKHKCGSLYLGCWEQSSPSRDWLWVRPLANIWGFRKWILHIIVQTWSCLMGKHMVCGTQILRNTHLHSGFQLIKSCGYGCNRICRLWHGFCSQILWQACRSNHPALFPEFGASSSTDILPYLFRISYYGGPCYYRSDSSYTYKAYTHR